MLKVLKDMKGIQSNGYKGTEVLTTSSALRPDLLRPSSAHFSFQIPHLDWYTHLLSFTHLDSFSSSIATTVKHTKMALMKSALITVQAAVFELANRHPWIACHFTEGQPPWLNIVESCRSIAWSNLWWLFGLSLPGWRQRPTHPVVCNQGTVQFFPHLLKPLD